MYQETQLNRHGMLAAPELSNEDQVLIHCARINLSQKRRKALAGLLSGALDWDELMEKATWHRLPGLVSNHLRSADLRALVPVGILKKLENIGFVSLARNMLLQDELSRIVAALKAERIPVIVLKGAALLGSVYQDISLRPMSDLDILVKPENLERAETVALSSGYMYGYDAGAQEYAKKNLRHLANLVHVQNKIYLEVHQHIVNPDNPYRFDISSLWTRARPLSIPGADAMTLCPEDMLIHLSINFLLDRHYNSNSALGQLCDISEVILQYGKSLDWDLIVNFAAEHRIASGLHCVFYICAQLLETEVPAETLRQLQPAKFKPQVARMFYNRRVLDTRPWLAHDLVAAGQSYSKIRLLRSFIGRVFFLPEEISQKGWHLDTAPLYFKRMKDVMRKLWKGLHNRDELSRDIQLDRWLHDIYSSAILK